MSVDIRIKCDGQPGGEGSRCLESCGAIHPWHTTATKIRRFWRNQGWHRTQDGRDIGPKCWEEGAHRGKTSPDWCAECEERRPCGCDPDGWTPLPGEDPGEDDWTGPDWTTPPAAEAAA